MKTLLALLLLTLTAAAQTPGQWTFQKRKASGAGFDLIGITGQNSKVFGINSSGQLEMVSASGSTTLAALTDVAFNDLADDQFLRYDSTAGDWINTTPGAWTLAGLSGMTDTITGSQSGIGWADGRFTIQGPEGALQMFETGSPAESVLYWAGRIQTGSIEAGEITGDIDAGLITSGLISASILNESMPRPFFSFVDGPNNAGASGLTYGNTGPASVNEPTTPGIYFPEIMVTDGVDNRNFLEGRIRTASQLRTDLGLGTLATISPTGTADSTTYLRGDGSWQTISAGVTPGGSSGQVQYNNAGSLGGVTGLTTTTGTLQTVTLPAMGSTAIAGVRAAGIGSGSPFNSGIGFFNESIYFFSFSNLSAVITGAGFQLGSGGYFSQGPSSATAGQDTYLQRIAAATWLMRGSTTTTGAALRMVERTAPASAPPADSAEIWIEDNGSGKTRLMIRFATGATQQIAIEP